MLCWFLEDIIIMKNKIIFFFFFLCICSAPVLAQLEVDSLGNTLISKNLYFADENGNRSMHSLLNKAFETYWTDGSGGMKMGLMGKLFLNPSDFGSNDIFNTEIGYTFDSPALQLYCCPDD